MSSEYLNFTHGVAKEKPERTFTGAQHKLALALAGVLLSGALAGCEGLGKADACEATMEPGDQGTHVIHLPGGATVYSTVEFADHSIIINAGDNAFSPKDYTHIVTAEAARQHPTVRYEATPAVQVAFHVSEDEVTTSCVAKPA